MCGIVAIVDSNSTSLQNEDQVRVMLSKIRHRGDETNFAELSSVGHSTLGCNRLAIVDRAHGRQPLIGNNGSIYAVQNGEIYNYLELRDQLTAKGYQFITECDTEVLVHGYQEWGEKLVEHLDGMFAFVVYDSVSNTFFAARDHIGIKPLYYLQKGDAYYFASEIKCLIQLGDDIQVLQPGHFIVNGKTKQYFKLSKESIEYNDEASIIAHFKELFVNSVKKMVQTDLPIGMIFSGGIDSAAVLSIARQYHNNITAFTIGFPGSPDVEIAKRYCEENKIDHKVQYLNIDDLICNVTNIVYICETFETIDVMDASLMYFAYKMAKTAGIKIILIGDGSDEVLAGYDFFKTSPDPEYLMTYRLGNLYRTDLQRSDRCSMIHSVEARPPFMDKEFLRFAYNVPFELKLRNGIEKWILREAMADYLPDYIRLRKKVRLPEGSGLLSQLLDFVRSQTSAVEQKILSRLKIDSTDGAYLLEEYLKAGFPIPHERYKKPNLDFSSNGYFEWSSDSKQLTKIR
ncbi:MULTISPECIES: asparagine synthase-related protein [unclassified Moorena]|uniref:asparagine synthetase B family protein n=1 Tax=unclassified Moorena TaxID=2683338 RepID=UPI0014016767|nr:MULTISPECIES: asparagine synthase-related protein [unclassified Moorena]NEO13078.1 asparagine synthetase B [Moorena sp. SIO3E8]NEP98096.1 asparagine synthetase B [Moorena sp. SIO3F7]